MTKESAIGLRENIDYVWKQSWLWRRAASRIIPLDARSHILNRHPHHPFYNHQYFDVNQCLGACIFLYDISTSFHALQISQCKELGIVRYTLKFYTIIRFRSLKIKKDVWEIKDLILTSLPVAKTNSTYIHSTDWVAHTVDWCTCIASRLIVIQRSTAILWSVKKETIPFINTD